MHEFLMDIIFELSEAQQALIMFGSMVLMIMLAVPIPIAVAIGNVFNAGMPPRTMLRVTRQFRGVHTGTVIWSKIGIIVTTRMSKLV